MSPWSGSGTVESCVSGAAGRRTATVKWIGMTKSGYRGAVSLWVRFYETSSSIQTKYLGSFRKKVGRRYKLFILGSTYVRVDKNRVRRQELVPTRNGYYYIWETQEEFLENGGFEGSRRLGFC